VAKLEIPSAFAPLFEPARYKAFHGGRGSGKSHQFASALVLRGAQKPTRWLCARETQKSLAASVKQLIEDKIEVHGLSSAYYITRDRIRGSNGTVFHFLGLRNNPEAIKSMEGLDGAWIEEAETCSARSIDLLDPTLRKPGSEMWCSWNRRYETDPVDNLFLGGEPPPGSVVRKVNWRDNPFFPEDLRVKMEWQKRRDYDKYLHVWEGEPLKNSNALVFHNWTIDNIDDAIPDNCPPRLGADWGFASDPTVLVECFVVDRTLYIRREAWKIRAEIDEIPSLFAGGDRNQPPRWRNVNGHTGIESAHRYQIIADSARPETISYMKQRGFNIRSAKKGPGSIFDGIEFMQSCDIVVHPDCTNVIEELGSYQYKIDPITDEVLPELAEKKNHTIDACRYALENVRRARTGRISIQAPQLISYH